MLEVAVVEVATLTGVLQEPQVLRLVQEQVDLVRLDRLTAQVEVEVELLAVLFSPELF
jgi:hypothetical protein